MSTANESGFKTFTATAVAIAKNVRVTIDSAGLISASGAANDWIGTTTQDIAASGTGTVRLKNSSGSHFFTASAAITRGNLLYPTASGKVDDAGTTGGTIGFVANEAASADGDIIEGVPTDAEGGLNALGDGQNIVLGTTTGSKIGTAVTQKLGFFNATPVVQPASANQTAVTDSTGGSVADAIAAVVTDPTAAAAATAVASAALTAATLTDNGGGAAADGTIADIASADASETTDRSVIADAIKELSDQINKLVVDITAQKAEQDKLVTDHADYISKQTANTAAVTALMAAVKELSTKVNEIINAQR